MFGRLEGAWLGNEGRHGALAAAAVGLAAFAALAQAPSLDRGGGPTDAPAAYEWRLPAGVEPPPVPADNPMTAAKVELGRRLFYDINLAGPGYMACATCHTPERGFADPRPRSLGVTGQWLKRQAPGLANVGYLATLGWADPDTAGLERQAHRPLFSEDPPEMAVRGYEAEVLHRLSGDPHEARLFADAFPEVAGRMDFDTVLKALAAFQRKLVSATAPWDRHGRGEADAIGPEAKRGAELFFGVRLGCSGCHSGPAAAGLRPSPAFHDIRPEGAPASADRGLAECSGLDADAGRFRAPPLRNVALTAPYLHDGSAATLEEAIGRPGAGPARCRPPQ